MTSVLASWKDIAQYVGKGIRTVQRWERELGLPGEEPTKDQNRASWQFRLR